MAILSIVLIAFGVCDLARWSADKLSLERAAFAVGCAAAVTVGVVTCCGASATLAVASGLGSLLILSLWLFLDKEALSGKKPGRPLAWLTLIVIAAIAAGSLAHPIGGPLEEWIANLPLAQALDAPADQVLLGFGVGLFLLATANRVVRLVLQSTGYPAETGEETLGGGRLLGPMERVLVVGLVIAGDPTGIAIVIAAKGLLRLPEIRDPAGGGDDHVTEYFLIGTFTSLLIAAGSGILVLAGT